MTTTSQQPMTYEDLLRLPEDLLRHELIGGEHYVSPAPEVKHQRIVLNLAHVLLTFLRTHRLGEVLIGPVDVLFSERDVVEPDVIYVSHAKADRLGKRYLAGAPDLVIEVLSPSNRALDRTKKYRLYEAQGVLEYWIVDPVAETLEVYRATAPGGPLALSAKLAAGEVLETPLLPGLRIPLSEVFEYTSQRPLTYQDLLGLPEDLQRHELIDGEHYVSPAPPLKHQGIVVNLAVSLSTFVRGHGLGHVLIGPVDVLFNQHDVVEPDVIYVSRANADRLRERIVAGAPDLVIEVLSPSSRVIDRTKKYRLYEAQGVPEYWIVDPEAETLEVFRATSPGGPLALTGSLSLAAGDVLATPLLPGLQIPLSEVFE